MLKKVAINGFGRVGRAAFKRIEETGVFEVVAINDLIPPENLKYLIQYDTVYGRYPHPVQAVKQLDRERKTNSSLWRKRSRSASLGEIGSRISF